MSHSPHSSETVAYAETRARVHLQGVLSGLEALVQLDPEAAGLAKSENFRLIMACRGAGAVTLDFKQGTVHLIPKPQQAAQVHLCFWSPEHLNRTFDNVPKTPPPLPLRGLLKPKRLQLFDRLTKILGERLRNRPAADASDKDLSNYVTLSLRVAGASLGVVAAEDPLARKWMSAWPNGMAQFFGPNLEPLAWLSCQGTEVKTGMGAAPSSPDVKVRFRTWNIAADAVDGVLENSTAVALGDVIVDGLLPLADKLGLVMERIPHYLKRSL